MCFSLPQTDRPGLMALNRGRSQRLLVVLIAIGLAGAALLVGAPSAGASITFTPPTPNVGTLPFPGDVSTIGSNGSLVSVDPSATPLSAPLFNSAGEPLNLTWGQFSSATAESYVWTVTRHDTTRTQFLIRMSGLVPNGVYSLFYRTFGPDSNNAVCPNVEPTVALTAAFPQLQKPDPDSFVATGSGRALFFASVSQDLLAASQLQVSVIYHFDGRTYGPVANFAESEGPVAGNGGLCRSSYGIDAMRQMLIIQK